MNGSPNRLSGLLREIEQDVVNSLPDGEVSITPSPLLKHDTKAQLIKNWVMEEPTLLTASKNSKEWKTIGGVMIVDFLNDEVNFEVLLDMVLYSGNNEEEKIAMRALKALTELHNSKIIIKFHKFSVVKKIVTSVNESFSYNDKEIQFTLAIKLLDYWIKKEPATAFGLMIQLNLPTNLLKHIEYSISQHFLYFSLINNTQISPKLQVKLWQDILPNLIERLISTLRLHPESDSLPNHILQLNGILNLLTLTLQLAATSDHKIAADEISSQTFSSNSYPELKKIVLENWGAIILKEVILVSLRIEWLNPWSKDTLSDYGDLVLYILQLCKQNAIPSIVLSQIDTEIVSKLESEICQFPLSMRTNPFNLPAFKVERPIEFRMLQLARNVVLIGEMRNDLFEYISAVCWNTLFMWFNVFKTNGSLCGLIVRASKLILDEGSENLISEVFISRGLLQKVITTKLEPTLDAKSQDFNWANKTILSYVHSYMDSHKNSITHAISHHTLWKRLQPPKPAFRPKFTPRAKKAQPFMLGVNSLERQDSVKITKDPTPKAPLHERLDKIYKPGV